MQIELGAPHVIVAMGDAASTSGLPLGCTGPSFAAAFVLARAPASAHSPAKLSALRQQKADAPQLPAVLAEHPCSGAFNLLRALAHGKDATSLALGRDGDEAWVASLTFGEPA